MVISALSTKWPCNIVLLDLDLKKGKHSPLLTSVSPLVRATKEKYCLADITSIIRVNNRKFPIRFLRL